MTTIYPIKVLNRSFSPDKKRFSFVDRGAMGDLSTSVRIHLRDQSVILCFLAMGHYFRLFAVDRSILVPGYKI